MTDFSPKPRIPVCPHCQTTLDFLKVEDGEEIYQCKCGICEKRKPEIKN